jgi:uncharacterized protein (TIGR02001 family)
MFTKNSGTKTFSQLSKATFALPLLVACATASTANAGEWSANVAVTNNYIWRGLTQTENESAVQGGIDYASDSGFYIGTWASNVNYGAGDAFSYEHDVYAGYAFDAGGVSWDIGYLYYNYDSQANYDFGEVYIGMGLGDFSVTYSLLANTEADEPEGMDFGFGEASYLSLDYGFELSNGVAVGLHVGHHEGDFAEDFNVTDGSYTDYNVTFSKDGFTFMITDTNVGGDSATPMYDNDSMKFVVSYAVDVEL